MIEFIGSPLEDIITRNGTNGQQWRDTTEAVCSSINIVDPNIAFANIRGAKAHLSTKDKDDIKEVITVRLQTKSGICVGTLHLHLDGTWKFFESHAGNLERYAARIQKANLPGYLPSGTEMRIFGRRRRRVSKRGS